MADSASAAPAAPAAPAAAPSEVQLQLVKLITDIVQSKPTVGADAVDLLHTLQVQLGFWLVSELPAAEQKAVLLAHWGIKEVDEVPTKSCGCLP